MERNKLFLSKSKKSSIFATNKMLALILLLASLVVLFVFVNNFSNWINNKIVEDECRVSMLANANIRFRDGNPLAFFTGSGADKERVPVLCPRLEDKEIKYNDLKKISSSKGGIKYTAMQQIAEEMRGCHFRYIGDVEGSVPFSSDAGTYCGLCRKISFDGKMEEEFDGNDEVSELDQFLTFLMNTKMSKSKMYYSEYLYGYRKPSDIRVEFDQEMNSNSNIKFSRTELEHMDFSVDPSRDYYIMHYVVKGQSSIQEAIGNQEIAVGTTAALCTTMGAVSIGAMFFPPAWPIAAVSGALTLGCYGAGGVTLYNAFGSFGNSEEQKFVRATLIVPVDSLDHMHCGTTYGINVKENEESAYN